MHGWLAVLWTQVRGGDFGDGNIIPLPPNRQTFLHTLVSLAKCADLHAIWRLLQRCSCICTAASLRR